ncbi:hypothetical protein J4V54_21965, partial [Escherichia coli]
FSFLVISSAEKYTETVICGQHQIGKGERNKNRFYVLLKQCTILWGDGYSCHAPKLTEFT